MTRTNSDRQDLKKIRMDGGDSQYEFQNDIKYNDKLLKKARQDTKRIRANHTPEEPLEYNIDE